MSDDRIHIDDLFRDELKGHKEVPPLEVWNKISMDLAAKKRRRIFYSFNRAAAVFLLLVGLGWALMHLLRHDEPWNNHLSMENLLIIPNPEPELMYHSIQAPAAGSSRQIALRIPETSTIAPDLTATRLPSMIEEPARRETEFLSVVSKSSETASKQEINILNQVVDLAGEKPLEQFTVESSWDRRKRWQAGVMITQGYSYRSLATGTGFIKTRYNNLEEGLYSLTGRLTITLKINNRLYIQSGLGIENAGQAIRGLQVFDDPYALEMLRRNVQTKFSQASPSFQNSMGPIHNNTKIFITDNHLRLLNDFSGTKPVTAILNHYQEDGNLIQELYYLQVPVLMGYRLLNGKTSLVLNGGLGANFIAGNRVMLKYEGHSLNIGETLGISNFGITGIAGLAIERNIGRNMAIILEPRFSHFLTPVNPGSVPGHHPYSLTLSGGISFGF